MFNIGDRVLLRTWRSMVNEFGIEQNGDIFVRNGLLWGLFDEKQYYGTSGVVSDFLCDDVRLISFDDGYEMPVTFQFVVPQRGD